MRRVRARSFLPALAVVLAIRCTHSPPSPSPSPEQLADATYAGIYDEPVRLHQGLYEGEPFVPGGASRPTLRLLPEPVASGDLDGEPGDEAAVLLVADSGGSGSFVYLGVVGLHDGAPVNLGTALIGDRCRVRTIAVEGMRIRLELLEHGPQDPACCPSQPSSQIWVLRAGGLERIAVGDS